jgi:hypothetical protein
VKVRPGNGGSTREAIVARDVEDLDRITGLRVARTINAERVAHAEARGANSWLPKDQTRAFVEVRGTRRAYVESLRPGRLALDAWEPAS